MKSQGLMRGEFRTAGCCSCGPSSIPVSRESEEQGPGIIIQREADERARILQQPSRQPSVADRRLGQEALDRGIRSERFLQDEHAAGLLAVETEELVDHVGLAAGLHVVLEEDNAVEVQERVQPGDAAAKAAILSNSAPVVRGSRHDPCGGLDGRRQGLERTGFRPRSGARSSVRRCSASARVRRQTMSTGVVSVA